MRLYYFLLFTILLNSCTEKEKFNTENTSYSIPSTPVLTTVSGFIDSLEKETGDKYVRILDFFPSVEYPEILASQKIDSSGIYQLDFLADCQRTYFFQFSDRTIPIFPKPGEHLRLNFSADYFLRLTNPENCVRAGGQGAELHNQLYQFIPDFNHWWSRRPTPGEVRLMGAADYKNYWLNIYEKGKQFIDTIPNQTHFFQAYINHQLDYAVLEQLYNYNAVYFRSAKDTLVLDHQYYDFESRFDLKKINQFWSHQLIEMIDKKRRAVLTNYYRSRGLDINTNRLPLDKELNAIKEKINPEFRPYAITQQLRQAIHQAQVDSAIAHLDLVGEKFPGQYLKQQLQNEIQAVRSHKKEASSDELRYFKQNNKLDLIQSIIDRHPDTLLCLIRWNHSTLSTIEALSETVQAAKGKPVTFIFFAENMTTYHWQEWAKQYHLRGDHYQIDLNIKQQLYPMMVNKSNFEVIVITPDKQLIQDKYGMRPYRLNWVINQSLEKGGEVFRRNWYKVIDLKG